MKHGEEVTLIQAVAECYNFNPRKKIESKIEFEIIFPDTEKTIRFGKGWSKIQKGWQFFVGETYCPTCGSEEKFFLSNLFCGTLAKRMICAAQSAEFTVYRMEEE